VDHAVQAIRDSIGLVLPEVVLVAAACVLFLGAVFYTNRRVWAWVALAALAAAACVWAATREASVTLLAASLFRQDDLTWFGKGIGLAAGVVFVLMSWNQVSDQRAAELHGCLLLIIAGANLVAAANDLVSLFLALELISIPTYVLLYLPGRHTAVQEATTKYFLLSIFSSALLLYGLSFLYGCAGSTNLEVFRAMLRATPTDQLPAVLVVSLVLILAGLGFRITAAPFHFYAPDVYQGAPIVGAALLAYVPKVAGFIALYQVITATLQLPGPAGESVLAYQATGLFWILATVSMCIGNLLALLQDNVKRLLAYSGVAHAGYMLIGLGAGRPEGAIATGIEALFFYLVVYGAMTVGAFAVLAYLSRAGQPVETLEDFSGLGRTHPAIALIMTVFLFSLTGLPPTAGFWGKLNLFFAAWAAGRLFQVLALLLAVNAAIGAWYYLQIVGIMYLRDRKPGMSSVAAQRETPALTALVLCAVFTVWLFVTPNWLWRTVEQVTLSPEAPATLAAPEAAASTAPAR
jgi:NADH-quinone oxidoreductase subunit N